MVRARLIGFTLLTAAVTLFSASVQAQGTVGGTPASNGGKAAKDTGKPNDAQIAAILSAANMNEIDAAKLAATKSTNEEVK